MSRTRRRAYTLARLLGDAEAVRTGRLGPRLWNRAVGRTIARRAPWWRR